MIYFDHNASTPLDERVLDAMLPFLTSFYGNPSSLYRQGRLARSAVDTAREQLATLIDCTPSQVVFTSGGTEANNLALSSLPPQGRIAISTTEHPSVVDMAERLAFNGATLCTIEVDTCGIIESTSIDNILKSKASPNLISIMIANNETGVIQDIKKITNSTQSNNLIFHTDAVQAVGKIPLSFRDLGVDLMTVSSHKIYGPKGCGALISRDTISLHPILLGGNQEKNLRPGTENVAAIVGFGKAAELAKTELTQRHEYLSSLKLILEAELLKIPTLTIFAQQASRLPNTTQFGIDGLDGEMLLMNLDLKGIAVSSGSACASGSNEISPVLKAMGVDPILAKSAIRISLGMNNTLEQILKFVDQLKTIINPR